MENIQIRLGKILISGQIEALTGLMVGGTNTSMQIGGVDKTVVRNPVSKRPYIPGSSIKGKLRSLIDLRDGTIEVEEFKKDGKVKYNYKTTQDHQTVSGKLFGTAKSGDDRHNQRPSKVIVRDAELVGFKVGEVMIKPEDLKDSDSLYTEFKAENTINRITSEANPRTFERVPKGGIFKFEIVVNYHDEDEKNELLDELCKGLLLLENDYLGGGGSRGNGQIKFKIEKVEDRPSSYYKNPEKSTQGDLLNSVPQDLR